jgi:uncharacterized SAM-binding protein YcdF (DUF218 family)
MIAVIATVALPPVRGAVLASAGDALVVDATLAGADVAVLPTEVGSAGELEIVRLVEEIGIRRVLVISAAPPEILAAEYARRNVHPIDRAELSRQVLIHLGVEPGRIEVLRVGQGGTNGESGAVVQWCENNGLRRAVIVSSRHHSRRLTRVLRRTVGGRSVAVSVWPTRYDGFDPSNWWEHRDSLRVGIVELQKLLLDVILHPIS